MAQKPGGRKLLIALIVVVVIVGIVAVGLSIVNRRAESEVEAALQEGLQQHGMAQNLSYQRLDVHSGRGKIRLTDFSFDEPGGGFSVDGSEITVAVPPTEAAAMARDTAAHLSRIDLSAKGVVFAVPGAEELKAGSLSVRARGDLAPDLFDLPPQEILQRLSRIEIELKDLGAGDLLSGQEAIEGIDAVIDLSPDQIDVSRLRIDSREMRATASLKAALSPATEPVGIDGTFEVEELSQSLRSTLGLLLQQAGQMIPLEGPFTIQLKTDTDGTLSITVE